MCLFTLFSTMRAKLSSNSEHHWIILTTCARESRWPKKSMHVKSIRRIIAKAKLMHQQFLVLLLFCLCWDRSQLYHCVDVCLSQIILSHTTSSAPYLWYKLKYLHTPLLFVYFYMITNICENIYSGCTLGMNL